ncbi:MAG: rhodanese-like domain-containing protein [bacterium]|nr:rhodanese-like domain-containing protein [bacterium]
MAIEQMTPPEAKAAIDQDANSILLDVRTEMEFAQGHPAGAINIPVAIPGPGGMQPNPEFMQVVEKVVAKDKSIFCSCAAGMRSQMAADRMAQAGYERLVNIQGGFGGLIQNGVVMVKGWQEEGLPVDTDVNDNNSYAGLKQNAGRVKRS